MSKYFTPFAYALTAISIISITTCSRNEIQLGRINKNIYVTAIKNDDDSWKIAITNNAASSFEIPDPITIDFVDQELNQFSHGFGYQKIRRRKNGFTAESEIMIPGRGIYAVSDLWTLGTGELDLLRKLKVKETHNGAGYASGILCRLNKPVQRDEISVFVPGMIYGGTGNLWETAIGGSYVYKEGKGRVWIREDRMPAPLYGFYFRDGSSITMLNLQPDGRTIPEDTHDTAVNVIIDDRMHFSSLGSELKNRHLKFGIKFPGIEGEITYKGSIYPHPEIQQWRRRFHPVVSGGEQAYHFSFRLSQNGNFTEYYRDAWRWAWDTYRPALNFHNMQLVEESIIGMLKGNVKVQDNRTGIPNWKTATEKGPQYTDRKTIMGFCGKALETAAFLIKNSISEDKIVNQENYSLGVAIINSFIQLNMSPPAGEGFYLDTGEPALAIPFHERIYLRSFCEGMKTLCIVYNEEKQRGIDHREWLDWMLSFAEWLLKGRYLTGGFPRAWDPGSGEVVMADAHSSYNVITFFCRLNDITGDPEYLMAAEAAANYCWDSGHSDGIFVGGTLDNPNVIDKEAGTLSLEAYLSLFKATKDSSWIEKAMMAANFAETWIYIWNVPMPQGENNESLHWKHNVPTIGLQLISTGHSLTDCWMAYDTDEFAELYMLTSDQHYLDVAMILLHNTKAMMALPDRIYDLNGPGWMQEHWCLSMDRGYGFHRGWLPWVSTSHLNGIYELQDLDTSLFSQMTRKGN